MKVRIGVATVLASLLFAGYLAMSRAPLRVHVATAMALVVAFWFPALFVRRPTDVWTRRWKVLGLVAAGVLVLDVGATITISKKELLDAPALFAVGIPTMIGLLILHGLIVRQVTRRVAV